MNDQKFKEGNLLRDLILLALSGVDEFVGIRNLMAIVENTSFKNYGFQVTRCEIKNIVFDLFLIDYISIEKTEPKGDVRPENIFRIKKHGLTILRNNDLFKEIAKKFPLKKEKEKKK